MIDIESWVEKRSSNSKERGNNTENVIVQSNADEAKRAKYADYAEEAGHTKVAEYAKVADKAKEVDEISLSSKTLTRFLRNDVADTAKEVITFLKGIVSKAVSYFEGIVNRGNINNTGDITTKNLTVTGKATFFELEILKAKAAGGIIIQSAATFKVDDFEDTAEGYVCYQLAEKDGKVLQQMCDKFDLMLCHGGLNVDVGVSHNVSNHYYWRMVTDAPEAPVERGGKKYLKIVLSKTEFATGSDKPQVGDEMAQVGNRVDADRQCVNISSAYHSLDEGLLAPYWAKYVGVYNFDLKTHRETYFAMNDNQIVGNLRARSSSGEIRPVPVLLGEWKSGQEYGYYDSVTHDGRQWLCIVEPGKRTTEEPGKGDAWMLLVDKGENGEDGHSLSAKAFMEGTYRNGCTKGVKNYVRVFYDGQEVKDFKVSYRYKGGGYYNWSEPESKSSDYWGDTQRNGSTIYVEYVVEYKGLQAVAIGRLDNIQDGKDGESVGVYKLIPVEEKAVAYFTDKKEKRVDVSLKYKVQYTLGHNVYFMDALYGIAQLRGDSNLVEMGGFKTKSDTYGSVFYIQKTGMEYKECPNNSYVVTLIRKDNIIDRRIVPIVFKANVIFDINTRLGTVTSNVENVKGDFSKIEQKVDSISSTVGNVKGDFSKIEQKVDSVSVKVGGLERGLHDTGIDIARREITATADNFKIRNNNGKETFFVDKDGKITAPLANIGDWKIEDGKIVSKLKSRYYNDNEHGNIIELDANEGCIRATTKNGADSKAATKQGGEVELDFNSDLGIISARNKDKNRYSSISPSGVFVNTADILCGNPFSGTTPAAGVVSLGFGKVDKDTFNYEESTGAERNFLAGVYGTALNEGNAPSYGGYFYKLKVYGLYKRTRVLFPRESRVSLDAGDTLLILFTRNNRDIYINLPENPYIGQTIEMINPGGGYGYIYTQDNTKIWWGEPRESTEVKDTKHELFTFIGGIRHGDEHVDLWIESVIGTCG